MPKPNLLYIAPVMPDAAGNGLAMRAGMILQALAARFAVHLFVVPVAGSPAPSAFAQHHTVRIGVLDLARHLDTHARLIASVLDPRARAEARRAYKKPWPSRFCNAGSAQALADWAGDAPFAAIHVMRLYLAPLVERRTGSPFLALDLDDDEMLTNTRLARRLAQSGDAAAARMADDEATQYQTLATRAFPWFDRVLVCSQADERRLAGMFPATRFAVTPNGCAMPSTPPAPRLAAAADGRMRLLFVGTLGVFANADAAGFLCREVLPAVRAAGASVQVDIVGGGAPASLRPLADDPDVTLHGFVDDLGPFYAAATVAVAPIRTGGGSRIKILEAFAHDTPVVATRLGAEGIAAEDGVHLHLADDAAAFARACLALRDDAACARSMAARAKALLVANHSPAAVGAALAKAYAL